MVEETLISCRVWWDSMVSVSDSISSNDFDGLLSRLDSWTWHVYFLEPSSILPLNVGKKSKISVSVSGIYVFLIHLALRVYLSINVCVCELRSAKISIAGKKAGDRNRCIRQLNYLASFFRDTFPQMCVTQFMRWFAGSLSSTLLVKQRIVYLLSRQYRIHN